MSGSIIILKQIEHFCYKNVLNSIKQAANKSNIHCIYVNSYFNNNEFEDLDGTLSEVNEKEFTNNYKNGIYTKQCTFNIHKPTEFDYNSFSWLINKSNYFWGLDFQNINDYKFIFHFLCQYFKYNPNDYLWFDDAEWYYSAKDIINLSNQPYQPEWIIKKISK